MSKKFIIIAVAVIIVVMAATIGTLYVLVPHSNQKDPTDTKVATTLPDLSKDYGACDLLQPRQIQDALGTSLTIGTGFDMGRGYIRGGDTSQMCAYGLDKDVTEISDTALNDTFYTTVYVYKDELSKASDVYAFEGYSDVAEVGDRAGYFVTTTDQTTDYSLKVAYGLRSYSLAIRQQAAKTSFDEKSAKEVLIGLAKLINYDKFATKQ